jgi:lysophospholipase-2
MHIYQAYPDLGHSIATEELTSLQAWIKGRLKASQDKES